MKHRIRIALCALGTAMLGGVGLASAQHVGSDGGIGESDNPAKADGAIQPGTLEHAAGAGNTDAMTGTKAKDRIALSAPVTATAEEIAQHPGQFFGKRVNVTTTVDRSIDPHFFTLESTAKNVRPPDNLPSQVQQFDSQAVLVLIESPVRAAPEQTKVSITGFVRPFVSADVERDYAWFERDWLEQANIDIQTTPQPLIVADSVMTSDGMQLVQNPPTANHVEAGDAPLSNPPAPPHREREPMPVMPAPDAIE